MIWTEATSCMLAAGRRHCCGSGLGLCVALGSYNTTDGKAKKYTVYITDNGRADNVFFVSLEKPPTTEDFPYTPGGDFDNLSAEEVEETLIKHLKITE